MPIPAGGLIHKYDIGDPASYPGSGTFIYDTIGSLDLNITGSPTYDANFGSLTFNGLGIGAYSTAGQYANITTTFSFSLWFKLNDGSVTQCLVNNGERTSAWSGYSLFKDSSNSFLDFGANFVWGGYHGSPAIDPNKWYNATYTFSGGTLKFYLDGVLISTTPGLGNPIAYGANAYLALGGNATAFFGAPQFQNKASYGVVLYYNLELNATQVEDIYNNYFERFNPPIVSYDLSNPACYPGSGSLVTNLGTTFGNNNLTLYGSPTFNNITDSLSFVNGVSSAYTAAGQYANVGSTFTINLWVKINDISVSSTYFLNGSAPSGGPYNGIQLYYEQSTGKFGYNFIIVQGSDFTMSNVVQGKWYQISLVCNGSTIKAYVDGVLTNTFGYAAYNPLNVSSYIGFPGGLSPVSGGTCSVGLLDIYTQELSSNDISLLYDNNLNRFTPALHYYDAADAASYPGSGTVFYDIGIGSLINLSINNATFDSVKDTFELQGSLTSYIRSAEGLATQIGIGVNNFSYQLWWQYNGQANLNGPIDIQLQVGSRGAGTYGGCNFTTNMGQFVIESPGVGQLFTGWYPTIGEWYLVTLTVNGSNLNTLYVDGVSTFTGTQSYGALNTYASIALGPSITNLGDGSLSGYGPLQIFNRVITTSEITDYYSSTQSRFAPPVPYQGLVGGRTFGQGFAG